MEKLAAGSEPGRADTQVMPPTATASQPLRPLLSFDETRALLGISETTLHRLRRDGRIASVKIADRRMFERSAVEEFIASVREDSHEGGER